MPAVAVNLHLAVVGGQRVEGRGGVDWNLPCCRHNGSINGDSREIFPSTETRPVAHEPFRLDFLAHIERQPQDRRGVSRRPGRSAAGGFGAGVHASCETSAPGPSEVLLVRRRSVPFGATGRAAGPSRGDRGRGAREPRRAASACWIDYSANDCTLSYWRTKSGNEVDFIVYGTAGRSGSSSTACRACRSASSSPPCDPGAPSRRETLRDAP